mgnify:CR=1 FL=1
MTMVRNGIWVLKEDPSTRIIIERVYKAKDTVDFFYCCDNKTGGGSITKAELIEKYTKE